MFVKLKRFKILKILKDTPRVFSAKVYDKETGKIYFLKRGNYTDISFFKKEFFFLKIFEGKYFPKPCKYFLSSRTPVLLLEFVEGDNLKQKFKKFKTLEEKENFVRKIIPELVEALNFIHKNHIIHGDLKPENILIRKRINRICITDLELSKIEEEETISGTPGFMAPENIQGYFLSFKSDIFSLGATLYNILFDEIPVKTKGMAYNREEYEKNINKNLAKLSPDLEFILSRMLAYSPSERADIDELMGIVTGEEQLPMGSVLFPEFFNREKEIALIKENIRIGHGKREWRRRKMSNIVVIKGNENSGKTRLITELKIQLLRLRIPFKKVNSVNEIFQPFIRKEKGIHGFETEKILPRQVSYRVIFLDDFDRLEEVQKEFFIENLKKFKKINYTIILTMRDVPEELKNFKIIEIREWNEDEKLEFVKKVLKREFGSRDVLKGIRGYPGEILYFLRKAVEDKKLKEEKGRIVVEIPSPVSFIEEKRSVENLSERERTILEFMSFVKKLREDVLISIFGKEYINEIQRLKGEDLLISSPPYITCAKETKITDKIKPFTDRMENLLDLFPYISLFHIMPHYSNTPVKLNQIAEIFLKKILEDEGFVGSFSYAKYIYGLFKNILYERIKIQIFKIFVRSGELGISQTVAEEIDITKLTKKELKEFYFWKFYLDFLKNEYEEGKKNLKNLENLCEPEEKAFVYNLNSQFYYNTGDYARAYSYALKAENASKKIMDNTEYVKSQFYKSLSLIQRGKSKEAIKNLRNMGTKKLKEPELIGRYFYSLGEAYLLADNVKSAILNFEKALEWIKFLTFYEHSFILNRLYIIYLREGNYAKAMELCTTALRWADYSLDRRGKIIDQANLGILYKYLERFRDAEKNIKGALKTAKDFNYPNIQIHVLESLLELYFQTENYEKIREIFNRELREIEENESVKNNPEFYFLKGIYAFRLNKFYDAEENFEKAINLMESKHEDYLRTYFYLLLSYLLNRRLKKYEKVFNEIKKDFKKKKDFLNLFELNFAFYETTKENYGNVKKILYQIIKNIERRKNKFFYSDYIFDIVHFLSSFHIISDPGCIIYGINDMIFEIMDIFEKFYRDKNYSFYFKTLRRFRSKMAEKEKIFAGKLPDKDLKLKSLLKMIEAVHEIEDSEKLFKRALDLLLTFYKVDRGAIFYYNKYGEPRLKTARNAKREDIEDIRDISESVIKQAMDRGILIKSVDIDKTPYLAQRDSIKRYGIRSILCIPLRTKKRIMGIIYLDSKKPNIFREEDVDLLNAFSRQISIALDRLETIIELAEEKAKIEAEIETLKEKITERTGFYELVGRSPQMQKVYETIEKIIKIKIPITVLVWGETGTGKELVARIIHFHGARRDGPFIAVNCGELPETLIEAELFGYVKGAFTGADTDKIGLFEAADGGTLLLDQIESLPLSLQAKLLRVIQYGEVRRLGSNTVKKINVMIIALSNQNLDLLVQRGEFREDLKYRLSAFEIYLPPLRERIEDIKPLAFYFFHKYRKEFGKNQLAGIEKRAMDAFLKYDWPGNVRELEGMIQRIVLMCDATMVRLIHLPPEIKEKRKQKMGIKVLGKEREYRVIVEALKSTNWNILRASKRLGISRPTLYKKIYEFGLKRPKRPKD